MNERRAPDAAPLDVDALLGKLTNVNKVHVACRGLTKPAAEAVTSSNTSSSSSSASGRLSTEIAAVRCVKAVCIGQGLPIQCVCACGWSKRPRDANCASQFFLNSCRRRDTLGARVVHLEVSCWPLASLHV